DQVWVHLGFNSKSYFPFPSIFDQLRSLVPNTESGIGNLSKYADSLAKSVKLEIPSFVADVVVHLKATPSGIQYNVSGSHDQFPSYELYINDYPAIRNSAVVSEEAYALLTSPKVQVRPQELQPLQVVRSSAN